MRVFKFGGASVKDASSIKNVAGILNLYKDQQIIVVISAMGKTTNAFEKVVQSYYEKKSDLQEKISEVKKYHLQIIEELGFDKKHRIYEELENAFTEIAWVTEDAPTKSYGFIYDQIVSQGELLSTKIVSAYLNQKSEECIWLDIRDCLITDNTYREGKIKWDLTEKLVQMKITELQQKSKLIITQGFIGATSENFTTTLGREGSDYTAAVLSYCLNATEMVVWKDVPGVLNADPKFYNNTVKLEEISYLDAIELTYFGATVIHPKTIKPLENKNIPLNVRSFVKPKESGTSIGNYGSTKPLVPCFIFKPNQILFSISAKDFSFIAEESLSQIFKIFAGHNAKINLMQNSAISFSVCVDNDPYKTPALIEELHKDFRVLYNDGLRLVTIRHYTQPTIDQLLKENDILIEQRSRHTAQLVMKENAPVAI